MAFTVTITKSDTESPYLENSFDQKVVKIGRADTNDIVLKDNFISRLHAEIKEKDGGYLLVSKASTWTYLEEKQIEKDQPVTLGSTANIRVPGFSIHFAVCEAAEEQDSVLENTSVGSQSPPLTAYSGDIDINVSRLSFVLRQAYSEVTHKKKEERIKALQETLVANMGQLTSGSDTKEILFCTLDRFKDRESKDSGEVSGKWQKSKLEKKSYEVLLEISASLAKLETLESEKNIELFTSRLKEIITLLVSNFYNSLSMYRQVQQEFDVEATKFFNLQSNPIKMAISPEAIGEYLLDPNGAPLEKVIEDVTEVHRDITVHQMAVLKGFKQSLQELLREMSPTVLAKEANIAVEEQSYKKLWDKFLGKEQTLIWNRYIEKYSELSENETRTFNLIINKFQNAYYSYVKKVRT